MALVTSSNFAKALQVGVNAWYGKAYDEYPVEWTKLFDQFTSRKAFEEDVGTSSFGLARVKPEGAAIEYDSEQQGFTSRYTHVTYGLGFIVTRESYEDDQYDVIAERRARGLAYSVRQTKENIAANVYNRAFNASYTGGDGQVLLGSAHPNIKGGTWSNILSTAANLSEAALEQACIDISKYTNDAGLRIAVMPRSIVIPTDNQFELQRILKTQYRVGSAENTISAIYSMGKFPEGAIVNHYLTSTTAWFVRTDVQNGMKYFTRRDDQFSEDNDWDTENAKFKTTFRASWGWTDPKGLYGTAGV